ncbi:MAG TPA: hypothetical protein VD837_04945 [Terriglobales bacterium]|nr:hypothetical protein [Terriglobales bacterium]
MLKNRLGLLVAVLILIVVTCESIAQTAETQPAKASSAVVVPAGTEIKVSFTQPRREMRPE